MVAFKVTKRMERELAEINSKYKGKVRDGYYNTELSGCTDEEYCYADELLQFSIDYAPKNLKHLWCIDEQGSQESAAWERWVYKDTPWKESTEQEYNRAFGISE